jgi:ADP-L-glycero-D-manno-heptose 6-epimerase
MIKNVFNQEPITLFRSGEQKRDWIYIEDVVKANIAGMDYNRSDIFNCATGVSTSFNQLVEIIKEKAPMPPSIVKIEYIDNPHESIYQSHTQCDISKLKSELYEPQYDIERGIEEYMNYATYELKLGNI